MEEIKLWRVNTWAFSEMRYGTEILNWNTDELKNIDRRTRNFMKMHGVLHPKSDVDRVYLSKELVRLFIRCEGCINMEEVAMVCPEFSQAID